MSLFTFTMSLHSLLGTILDSLSLMGQLVSFFTSLMSPFSLFNNCVSIGKQLLLPLIGRSNFLNSDVFYLWNYIKCYSIIKMNIHLKMHGFIYMRIQTWTYTNFNPFVQAASTHSTTSWFHKDPFARLESFRALKLSRLEKFKALKP